MTQIHGIDTQSIFAKAPTSHYEIYVDGTNDIWWDDTTHYVVTVPAGKVYWLWGGWVDIENNATVDIVIQDASGNLLIELLNEAASTGAFGYPDPALHTCQMPIPMAAGWEVEILFGAAQSTAAFASCVCTIVDATE